VVRFAETPRRLPEMALRERAGPAANQDRITQAGSSIFSWVDQPHDRNWILEQRQLKRRVKIENVLAGPAPRGRAAASHRVTGRMAP
jgi:hypothetical protein